MVVSTSRAERMSKYACATRSMSACCAANRFASAAAAVALASRNRLKD